MPAPEVPHYDLAIAGGGMLWRRTKCGMHLALDQRNAVAAYLREQYGHE